VNKEGKGPQGFVRCSGRGRGCGCTRDRSWGRMWERGRIRGPSSRGRRRDGLLYGLLNRHATRRTRAACSPSWLPPMRPTKYPARAPTSTAAANTPTTATTNPTVLLIRSFSCPPCHPFVLATLPLARLLRAPCPTLCFHVLEWIGSRIRETTTDPRTRPWPSKTRYVGFLGTLHNLLAQGIRCGVMGPESGRSGASLRRALRGRAGRRLLP
jgi:hypothetical protein